MFGLIAPRLNAWGKVLCPGVTFCSSKQSLKLCESPIDQQHKYEQIWKESWGRAWSMSDFQQSDPQTFFNGCEFHCYNTADVDDLATQRTRSLSAIVLSHLTRNILISTQETLIFWENGLFNGRWRLNSPASRLFTQSFIQVQIK